MRLRVFAILAALLASTMAWAAEDDRAKELDRVRASSEVLDQIMGAPDKGVPEEILKDAECVAVVPSMLKGGFIFGARYGKGVATCRTAKGWSAPAPIKIAGGSWGAQIGGEAVDLVMLVMNEKGMRDLLDSKFKIGADISGAAGPIGRHAEANTDWKMRAEVLTYSRARGAFAGIELNGAAITQDNDDTRLLFGRDVSFRQILTGGVAAPAGTQPFLQTVSRYFRQSVAAERRESARAQGQGGVSGAVTGHAEEAKSAPPRSVASAAPKAASNNPSAATPVSDAIQVQNEVAAALKNQMGSDADNIMIAVNASTLKLSGSLPSNDLKAKAVQIAQSKAGDRRVDASDLNVK